MRVFVIWARHHQVGANHRLLIPLLHSLSALIPLVVVVGRIHCMSRSPLGRCEPSALIPLVVFMNTTCCGCLENPRGHNRGNLTRRRNGPNIHKGMTPPLTQNLKAVGLWVFFLIYCLTFSFLFNVGLRLTLGFLTISP